MPSSKSYSIENRRNPCGASGDDTLAPQNGGGHAKTFGSPAEYRLQDGINIDWGIILYLANQFCQWRDHAKRWKSDVQNQMTTGVAPQAHHKQRASKPASFARSIHRVCRNR